MNIWPSPLTASLYSPHKKILKQSKMPIDHPSEESDRELCPMMPFLKEVRKMKSVQKMKSPKYGQIILRGYVNMEKRIEKMFAEHPAT